jgi:hypothetical protein
VEIVVPKANIVNALLWKNQKIYSSVANGSHPSTDQGGGKRRVGILGLTYIKA